MLNFEKNIATHHEMASIGQVAKTQNAGHDPRAEIEAYENRDMDLRTIMAIIALALSYEAAVMSFVLPVGVLLSINADIGPSTQINWVATAWSLSTAVAQTVTGRCMDIFGRRNFMIGGNLLGVIGCAIGARASSVNIVIVGTAFMGVGSGAQQLAFACANEIVPRRLRGQTLAFLSLAAIPASGFASPIAYAMVAHLSWRWTFYLGIIISSFALIMCFTFYWPPSFIGLHPEGKTAWQQFTELDFVGLVLFGGGLSALILGLSFGNNPYPWTTVVVLLPMILGLLSLLIVFPLWEVYGPQRITKLCPPSLFKNTRGFSLPLAVIFVSGMLPSGFMASAYASSVVANYIGNIDICLEIQSLFTTHPTTVGWYGSAFGAGSTVGAIVGGYLFGKCPQRKWQFVAMTILQTTFIALMASVTPDTPGRAITFVALAAFGVGASQIIGVLITQLGVADSDIGIATGLVGSVRSTGGSVAIAIYGSIISNEVGRNLSPRVAAAAVAAGLPPPAVLTFIKALTSGSAKALASVEDITPGIILAGAGALKSVYSDAFKYVYLVSIAFGGTAILVSVCIGGVDKLLTGHAAVKLDAPRFLSHRSDKTATLEDKSVV